VPGVYCFGGQTSALVVRKTKAAAPELSPQDAILFAQVFDRVPLLLVHPTATEMRRKRNGPRFLGIVSQATIAHRPAALSWRLFSI
jgi:hypothetical protein